MKYIFKGLSSPHSFGYCRWWYGSHWRAWQFCYPTHF